VNCKKNKDNHRAKDSACPIGTKTRIGYTSFHKTQKYYPKLPHGEICFDCGPLAGLKWKDGHICTAWQAECPYCGQDKSLVATTDFIFPREKDVKIWD